MGTGVGIVLLVAIGVGFPLLALHVGRRFPLPGAPAAPDDEWALARRLRLSWQDEDAVARALGRGERSADARLRPAVVAIGRHRLQQRRRERASALRFARRWRYPVAAAAVVGAALVVRGPAPSYLDLGSLAPGLLNGVGLALLGRLQRRRLERAVRLNQDSASP
ncbi:hypothetical protein [Vallicoccus soli]|uniref:Uncharacterized protein n=1 Tax=Vallicoccus soli TaxID=2339232 RepID=A0A3A3YXU1_9ACTN|nr:hypothetical protein [Vallicoccus soli]RJK94773.1 hypothetical protein D5H78_13150 [Vallicoccus soli]